MIAFIQGILVDKSPASAIVDVGGVGYEVFIPLSSYDRLPAEKSAVKLLTHHLVREDAQLLYGFATEDERAIFRRLLDVNGIGPRIALSVLSGLSVREIKAAIVNGDSKRLSGISGIGKKTAERIVVELKDKITGGEALEAIAGADDELGGESRIRDAALALVSLGYKQADALRMIRSAMEKAPADAGVEDLIRRALAG